MSALAGELVMARIRLARGDAPEPVMVTIADRGARYTRVIVSDRQSQACDLYFLSASIARHLDPTPVGDLFDWLRGRLAMTRAVLRAGGDGHGSLTIARAIHRMEQAGNLAPVDALDQALQLGLRCEHYAAWMRASESPDAAGSHPVRSGRLVS